MPFAPRFAPRLPRRHFLFASAAGGVATLAGSLAGCRTEPVAEDGPVERTDVPLRVLLCGTAAWADAIQTAWGGVSQQPLSLQVLAPPTAEQSRAAAADPAAGFGRQVTQQMLRCDVAIVPCGLLPGLSTAGAFTPLGDAFLDQADLGGNRMLPVLRESAARWAAESVAVPLGSVQPALLLAADAGAEADELPQNWDDFLQLAARWSTAGAGGGSAVAEPLAGGAAARMFLWRASDAAPAVWLFDRENFEPVLEQEAYVQTLQNMQACAKHYGDNRLTAGEVWNAVARGELKLALSWRAAWGDPPRAEPLGDVRVGPLPQPADPAGDARAERSPRSVVMANPDGPIGLLSSRCRQSAVAKRFLTWLCGGEGSEMVRDAAASMTVLRTAAADSPESGGGAGSGSPSAPGGGIGSRGVATYPQYLQRQLGSIHLRPTLRLHRYDQYLAALDQQVLACLNGQASAAEALAAASAAWRAITAEVGVQEQAQAWRRAQGLRN